MIYVVCPAANATGGTELCHQLARTLLDKGVPASMLYVGKRLESPVPERFKKYALPYITDIRAPGAGDTVVIPETRTLMVHDFPASKKYIWWMSVDNYFLSLWHRKRRKRIAQRIRRWLGLEKLFDFSDASVDHLCQSHYAVEFLRQKGVTRCAYLSDYLNDAFFVEQQATQRADRVIYNPKKGYEFTRKIIEANPDIEFTPIENMTPAQIRTLMQTSKVYIDFGNHPGKDRLPRESAICGCCIVTSRDGTAAFAQDLPIPEHYKIDKKDESIAEIGRVIRSLLAGYDEKIRDFQPYVEAIRGEPKAFLEQVDAFIAASRRA